MSNELHIVSHASLSYLSGHIVNPALRHSRPALDMRGLLALLPFLGCAGCAVNCFNALYSLTFALHNTRMHDSTLHRLGVIC